MKNPLQWHKDNLNNSQASLLRIMKEQQRAFADAEEQIRRLCALNDLLRRQITEAERRGMDGFDGERFLVKRKVKS